MLHSGSKSSAPDHDLTTFGLSGRLYLRKFGAPTKQAFSSCSRRPFAKASPKALAKASGFQPSSADSPATVALIAPRAVRCGCVRMKKKTSLPLSESARNFASFQMRTSILR